MHDIFISAAIHVCVMLIIPVKKYIGSEKKMGNFETGLILLAAVLLFGGASHILASDLAVSTALLLGSLALLSWGLVKGLRLVGEGEKTTNPSTPGDIGPVTFGGFSRADDKFPWCVATKYRIAYEVNGVISDWSDPSDSVYSITETDPIIRVSRPNAVNLVWQRSVGPNFTSWNNHQMQFVTLAGGSADYKDVANPCETPYRPDPPPAPVPNGTMGENNVFTMAALEGSVPWCVPTRYFAKYVRNGQESAPSALSDYFKSNGFTFPRLMVPDHPGYDINWYREVGPCETFITLPEWEVPGEPIMHKSLFSFVFGNSNNVTRIIDLSSIWVAGSPTLTLCLTDFVTIWNNTPLLQLPGSVEGGGGLLGIDDGKLFMTPVYPAITSPVSTLFYNSPWWQIMGFNTNGIMTNTVTYAARAPNGQLTSQTAPIGVGPVFTDMQNPCQLPNPPTSAPAFDRFNYQF
jgi:hypothetical protein